MKSLIAVFLLFLPISSLAESTIDIGDDLSAGNGYFQIWDRVQNRLIFFRDVKVSSAVGVRLVNPDGTTVAIYPMKDFPTAHQMQLWAVAATPEGGCVIATVVEYGPREVKPVPLRAFLAMYGHTGNLMKLWNSNPYEMHYLAVDRKGNVYAVGEKNSKETNYPMGIVYSPDGNVIKEFFPANAFLNAEQSVNSFSGNGENQMFMDNDRLIFWLAGLQEILRFNLDGQLERTLSFSAALKQVADRAGARKVEVLRVGPLGNQFVFQARIWPADNKAPPLFGTLLASGDGVKAHSLGSLTNKLQGRFMGTNTAGQMVFLENVTKTTAVMTER
jgi:hypothetical protein